MKLIYFLPLPIGLDFIFWLYHKCCMHEKNKLDREIITESMYDKVTDSLAQGTVNLMLLWIFVSIVIGFLCLHSE